MFRCRSNSQPSQESEEHYTESKIKELKDEIGPLSVRSLKYCTDSCLRRYLEACNWNAEKSKKMLECTLKWRSTYKPEDIRWDEVAMEGETGKMYRASFHDREGRTVLVMRPGMQIVKFMLDNKTFQKVKFVYPNNKDSVELMKCYFDEENLPIEFGGKGTLNYNHEEFSRLMAQDDLKSAAFWGSESDDKLSSYVVGKGHSGSGAEVALDSASHDMIV